MSTRIKAEPQTHLSTTWSHAEIANLKAENARLQSALATARREALEEAAKVVADYKQKQRATRLPNSASAYDTWHDHTCGQLEAAIRALLSQSVEGNNA